MNLNKRNLRHLILQEMRTLLREESDSNRFQGLDQDFDLYGLEVGGRPHLNGLYRVVSDGSYRDLGSEVNFEVLQYTDDGTDSNDDNQGKNHSAVGNTMTLGDIESYNNQSYHTHPLWDRLIAAADAGRAALVSGEGEGAALSRVEPDPSLDQDVLGVDPYASGERTFHAIAGKEIDLPVSEVEPEVIVNPGVESRPAERIARWFERVMGDNLTGGTVPVPLGVAMEFWVQAEEVRSMTLATLTNTVDPDILGDVTISPMAPAGDAWTNADAVWSVPGDDAVENYNFGRWTPMENTIITGYNFSTPDDENVSDIEVKFNNPWVDEASADLALSAIQKAWTGLPLRLRQLLVDADKTSAEPALRVIFQNAVLDIDLD
jgi:hypothetical protein